jgi:hypothetical protein
VVLRLFALPSRRDAQESAAESWRSVGPMDGRSGYRLLSRTLRPARICAAIFSGGGWEYRGSGCSGAQRYVRW